MRMDENINAWKWLLVFLLDHIRLINKGVATLKNQVIIYDSSQKIII